MLLGDFFTASVVYYYFSLLVLAHFDGFIAVAAVVELGTSSVGDDHEKIKSGQGRGTAIPKLHLGVDDPFFDKDYPHDLNPRAGHRNNMVHPYPAVQDSEYFDRDYVTDENADNGEWKAQMEYDTLRHKVWKQRQRVKEALRRQQDMQQTLKEAIQRKAAAAEAAKMASGQANEAREVARKATDNAENVTGAIGEAVEVVRREMDDLEACRKQLAAARAQLKALVKEAEQRSKDEARNERTGKRSEPKTAANTSVRTPQTRAQKPAEKTAQETSKKTAQRTAQKRANTTNIPTIQQANESEAVKEETEESARVASKSKEAEKALLKEREALERRIAEEELLHAKAVAEYEKEAARMRQMKEALEMAADRLRGYRNRVDGVGGVFRRAPQRNSARTKGSWADRQMRLALVAASTGIAGLLPISR